jgi:glycerophosphoryl diester phosphodiesterase
MIDIDMKTGDYEAIVEVVKKTKTGDQVFYFDNDYEQLENIRKIDKKAMIMPRAYSYEMADSALKLFNPPVVHIDPSFYDEKVCTLIRDHNARIWINSLGEADARMRYGDMKRTFDKLTKYGANVIQTNEPEMLLEYLRAIGKHK